jgi:hypothetical protein
MNKLTFKLFSVVIGAGAGLVARRLFTHSWEALSGEDNKPQPTDREAHWGEIVVAAALEGALFAAVRAFMDRAGAVAIARSTGTWPD